VDYSESTGPRPAIVFRDKVYIPDPVKLTEHPMTVTSVSEVGLVVNDVTS